MEPKEKVPEGLVDLASRRIGGKALLANDEFFAPKENLLKPGRGIFIPDKYTIRGKWMDGWESRRRRTPGNDWCVIKLGERGTITTVDIDTNFFLGNHPPFASLDAIDKPRIAKLTAAAAGKLPWTSILPKSPLNPGSQNLFDIVERGPWTHVRLNIFPDGGVARFKAYGNVIPDFRKIKQHQLIDLAAITNGGVPLSCSDMFFSSMNNLLMPGRSTNMGDGWETRRRRGPGYDWIVVKLCHAGTIKNIEIDTNHFKGNYPDTCSIEACYEPDAATRFLPGDNAGWKEILPKTKLHAHKRHFFTVKTGTVTHVRLNIYPDGGVSRMRVWGHLSE
ncbi:MAG TPA: allantoicase [Bacteroidota bacterium]|jgi:allantoicase|nr:allantoicase [Bacteroidota bacterium]